MAMLFNNSTITQELAAVAAHLSRSTVVIRSRWGDGSGVIWSQSLIITNAHVVKGTSATVELNDGRIFEAICISRDADRDLAALKIDAQDLPVATIANSDAVRTGEMVLAVGNPLGVVGAVTTGIIHTISAKTAPSQWVQADISLAPGNSGGPLADVQGRVIGINTVIVDGLALAVPSNAVEKFLRLNERPYLGVTLQPVMLLIKGMRRLGLSLLEVRSNSLAEAAGLLKGDILIAANSQFFSATTDLAQVLAQINPGDTLQFDLLRAGRFITCQLDLTDGGKTGLEAA